MLVHKYICRPADEQSESAALDEIARYVQARNRLLKLSEKWKRIREDMILPEFRALAETLRDTPRTGRKPAQRAKLVASEPLRPKLRASIEQVVTVPNVDKAIAALKERYATVVVADTDLARPDHEELRAADNRALYAEFIAAGGSYATWWLADKASKKAVHPLRDETAGRAGMMPEWLEWDGDGTTLRYCGTAWTVHHKQLRRRPVPADARIAQAWLQRERTSLVLRRPAPDYSWFLVLVLDVPARVRTVSDDRTAAGLDIAWRQDDDTLRVAYVADDAGMHRPLRMRAQNYARLQHAASLASLADEDANWLRAHFGVPANTSHRRLLELAVTPPDAAPYDHRRPPVLPHEYAAHMVHLLTWFHGARRNQIASRDEHYKLEAHALCRAHHTIFVEKIKATPKLVQRLGTRKKKGAPDEAEAGVARDQRQMAAPFTFLRMLQREAPKFSTAVVEVPSEYTSRICECGYDMGKSGKLERVCAGCGDRWDVDHLAALNLLRWGGARKISGTAAE